MKQKLMTALNEKDVENIYRDELIHNVNGSQISSPYGVDGVLSSPDIYSLLEFKYKEQFKSDLTQCSILIQCLYYLKKFENAGQKLPSTIFVGDINECFALGTNAIIKYLSKELDWKIAPSEASKKNVALIQEMIKDENIRPFVFDITESFTIKEAVIKLQELTINVLKKIEVTESNILSIFDYFDKNVLGSKCSLNTNEKSNLFIQIVINPSENYLHPKLTNVLITKGFGEIPVNKNLFVSFFSHFEGEKYSPRQKEKLTGLIDRLVEDSVRRNKGEFFTPTPFVNLAHQYIEDVFGKDWKERFIVWDCAFGVGNLTRDYRFKELYCSTLEKSDIDTANQMGYNTEATKFVFDFLNDGDDKLPQGLQDAISSGKEILFFINPPYGRSNGEDLTKGATKTLVQDNMKKDKWGACSAQLYAQFMYRIAKYQEINKNINLCIYAKSLYKTGSSFKIFRENFYKVFKFERGMLFNAGHFSDTADSWGVDFSVFSEGKENSITHVLDICDLDSSFAPIKIGDKYIYNLDNEKSASDWVGKDLGEKEIVPKLSSAMKIKGDTKERSWIRGSIGFFVNTGNNVMGNSENVNMMSSVYSHNGTFGNSVTSENFNKCVSLFTARKTIIGNWINDKDEYLAPNETHPDYEQFTYDSIIYSLFNNSSQQSSLRQITYKDKLWDIKNEFFWLPKSMLLELAEKESFDALYKDAKTSEERFVYLKLSKDGIYKKLSPDAQNVLNIASDLVVKSFPMRKIMAEQNPEYHLSSWDCGYAQLKLVWKEYFSEEFKEFRNMYKAFENRLRPLVYTLGFLK